nr:MAG TPA: hypothetical protein [Caudoviricetes sp.]
MRPAPIILARIVFLFPSTDNSPSHLFNVDEKYLF